MKHTSNNFIEQRIQTTLKNRLIRVLCVLAAAVALSIGFSNYFYNQFFGPFPMTQSEIANFNPDTFINKSYVTFIGEHPIDTGYDDIEQTYDRYSDEVQSEEKTGTFWEFESPTNNFLVKATPDHTGTVYQGFLTTIPDYVKDEVIAMNKIGDALNSGNYLPVMLDETNKPNIIWPILLALVYLYVIWDLFRIIRDKRNLNSHKLISELKKYGDHQNIMTEIDNEVGQLKAFNQSNPATAQAYKKVILTKSWLIQLNNFDTPIVALKDIVWVYPKVISNRAYFVTVKKNHFVMIKSSRQQNLQIHLSEKASTDLINDLRTRVPSAIIGFTPQLNQLWKKTPQDFQRQASSPQK